MNWKRFRWALVFFLLYGFKTGYAFSPDSSKLREYCKLASQDSNKLSGDDLVYATVCLYYVTGVLDGYESGTEPEKRLVCIPDGVSNGQMALVVAKYLEDHPEKLHNPARFLILDALMEAFPCKPEPPRK